jgi:hypothetical protein
VEKREESLCYDLPTLEDETFEVEFCFDGF